MNSELLKTKQNEKTTNPKLRDPSAKKIQDSEMQKTPEKETSNVHEWLSVYKPFVSHSNSLITCSFKPSARLNNLATRSFQT